MAEKVNGARLAQRTGASRVRAAEIPILAQTAEGTAFLDRPLPRALAYGDPPAQCPAIGISRPGARGRAEAVETAFTACFAALDGGADGSAMTMATEECGCRLGALDDVVLLPREETVYARGTAARLRAPALGIDGLFVAGPSEGGGVVLSGVQGPFAIVAFGPEGTARLAFLDAPATVFEGADVKVGFRRGRLARRLYLQDVAGRRVSLLIGFAPAELEAYAAGWLAFPDDAVRPVAGAGSLVDDG
ncbi:MAG: hypothetical protein AAF371_15035 [Pseudomonadota bacterium]